MILGMFFYDILSFLVECIRTPRGSSCFVWSVYSSFWSVIYTHTHSYLFEHVILKSVEHKWMENYPSPSKREEGEYKLLKCFSFIIIFLIVTRTRQGLESRRTRRKHFPLNFKNCYFKDVKWEMHTYCNGCKHRKSVHKFN